MRESQGTEWLAALSRFLSDNTENNIPKAHSSSTLHIPSSLFQVRHRKASQAQGLADKPLQSSRNDNGASNDGDSDENGTGLTILNAQLDCNRMLQKMRLDSFKQTIPTQDEIDLLVSLMEIHSTTSSSGGDRMINYGNFQDIRPQLSQRLQNLLKPSIFAHLKPDEHGGVNTKQIHNFVIRRVSLMNARCDLSVYDEYGHGFLSEKNIEQFVADNMLKIPHLRLMDPAFKKFYLCTATRKFIFHLDAKKKGKLLLSDILVSPELHEFLMLRNSSQMLPEMLRSNWFSIPSTRRIYNMYINLDMNRNGMLSRDELARYNNSGSLSDAFLDRYFAIIPSYGDQIDFKTFLDFILAFENKATPAATRYLFKLLDMRENGCIDEDIVRHFYTSVATKMRSLGQDSPPIEDVVNEVFDMVHANDTRSFTLTDLLKSGVGGSVLAILFDIHGFYLYENREALAQQAAENSS